MSLKTRIAVWENNGRQRRTLNRYAQERAEIRKTQPNKPGSEMPEYMPWSHQNYTDGASQETIRSDFRSGSLRIARRAIGAIAAGAIAYSLYSDLDKSAGALPAQPVIEHETTVPVNSSPLGQQYNELAAPTFGIDS